MAAQIGVSRSAIFTVFVALCLLAASVGAHESVSTPSPAPGPDAGAGFAMSTPSAFIGFSVILSFVGLFLQ